MTILIVGGGGREGWGGDDLPVAAYEALQSGILVETEFPESVKAGGLGMSGDRRPGYDDKQQCRNVYLSHDCVCVWCGDFQR